jgi:SM-20-related protein
LCESTRLSTLLLTRGRGPFDGDVFAQIVEAIRKDGYIILNKVFTTEQLQTLFLDIKASGRDEFQAAGIGRQQEHHVNRFVRSDRIRWLSANHEPVQFYLEWTEQLRQCLNRVLYLGLFDYECHYAHYPKGAFYRKHLDAFKGDTTNRILTTILYLNPSWQFGDGGELVIYAQDSHFVREKVNPTFGTMVFFLSEEFPHEVLSAKRSRYSLTGWFRVNNTGDPGSHLRHQMN